MPIKLELVHFPDPILRETLEPVSDFNAALRELVENMHFTMLEENGIGLAANQIGVNLRVITVDVRQPYTLVNPVILKQSEDSCTLVEGCLSFPGEKVQVSRVKWIKVQFQDAFGKSHVLKFRGLEARCILHELDHLNGIVFTDYT